MDEEVWDVTVFTKNRERLLEGEIAQEFFEAVLRQAEEQGLLSEEHFTVDGTLIEPGRVGGVFRRRRSPPSEGRGAEGADVARHARKPDGSGSAAVQEERGGRSETQLFGTPGDGKPEWLIVNRV